MKLGLIAGNRYFPQFFAQNAKKKSTVELIGVGFAGITEKSLEDYVDKMYWIGLGQLGKLIKIFKKEEVKQSVMVGQIPPTLIFKALKLDLKGIQFMSKVRSMQSVGVLGAFADELTTEGIEIISSISFLDDHLATPGINGKVKISDQDQMDVEFGTPIAKQIIDLDVGQTIVVKHKSVVAVEALEGTDMTIQRAGELINKKGGVVFKLAMSHHDLRFDVPVVGSTTIETLKKARMSSLVVSSEKTLFLDKPKVLKLADQAKISIVGVDS